MSTTTIEEIRYGFDRNSRRAWRQRATTRGWDNAYVYDALGQVLAAARGNLNQSQSAIAGVPAVEELWTYDSTGNCVTSVSKFGDGSPSVIRQNVYDRGNRLMHSSDSPTFVVDRSGRTLEGPPTASADWDVACVQTWDGWNRITSVGVVTGGGSHSTNAEYKYDGLMRRVTVKSGFTRHTFYNDEWKPLEVRLGNQTSAEKSYLWGCRHRDDLVRRDRSVTGGTLNEVRYVLMDYFNPIALVDVSGSPKERYQFGAFGVRQILSPEFVLRSTSECEMDFSFQGQIQDAGNGLINYGYRYYNPGLGRWLNKDPIGEAGGANPYTFAGNMSVNYVDHLGLLIDNALIAGMMASNGGAATAGAAAAAGGGATAGGGAVAAGGMGLATGGAVVTGAAVVTTGVAVMGMAGLMSLAPATTTSLPQGKPISWYPGYDDADAWADDPYINDRERLRRRRKVSRCRGEHKRYKDGQKASQGYTKAKGCEAICKALDGAENEAIGRSRYLDGDCDEVQWTKGGNTANHKAEVENAKNKVANLNKMAQDNGCECPPKESC